MPVNVEKLTALIHESKLLSAAEKQEWLRLVGFMNDKQLLDLYHILVPNGGPGVATQSGQVAVSAAKLPKPDEKQSQPQTTAAKAEQKSDTPPASQGVSLTDFLKRVSDKPKPQVKPVVPVAQPLNKQSQGYLRWKKTVDLAMTEKELPDHVEKPAVRATQPDPPPPPEKKIVPDVPTVTQLKKPSLEQPPEPESPSVEVLSPEPVVPAERDIPQEEFDAGPETISVLSDVSLIGIGTFRFMGGSELEARLVSLAKRHGYFEVLFAIEQSPLYEAYVATGKKLIGEQKNFEQAVEDDLLGNLLTRAEFESVADMLRRLGGM